MKSLNQKILVWGLSGVGKTTFINALPRELSLLLPDLGLRFELDGELPEMKTTEFGTELQYVFKILDQNGNEKKKYDLGFYDDKGSSMESAVLDIDDDANSFIVSYIKSAKGIVALFEPGVLLKSMDNRHKSAKLIQNLLKVLSQRTDKPCLAICINKMDTISSRWNDPETFFELCFGNSWSQVKTSISKSKNVQVSLFLASAAGFVRDSSYREYQNFHNNAIAVEYAWRPWNVSAPFFWIFDNFEEHSPTPWYSFGRQDNQKTYPAPFF